jgi:hypothetical protein
MKRWSARRAAVILLLLVGLLGVTTLAWGQFASKTGDTVGVVGGACTSATNTYGWPDTNGNILKCVANVWTAVAPYWDNTNVRLGIGSSSPVVTLDLSQRTDALALPVGTTGQEPGSPLNGMIRYNTTLSDVEAYIAGAWTTLTTGGSLAAITLGTSAATPDPASSFSVTTGEFSPASGVYAISSAGTEMMRVNATGVGIGTNAPQSALHIGSGQILTPNGSAAAPAVAIGTANTGLYSVASTGLGLSVNGSDEVDFGITTASQWTLKANTYISGNTTITTNGGQFQLRSGNTILSSPASATWHLGAADAASPVAQTFGVQNVVAGTTDTAGADFTIRGSRGTGTGAGGNIVFQTAPAGASGTSQNPLVTDLTLSATGSASGGAGSFGNLATTLQTTAASGTDKNGATLTLASGVSTGTGSSSMNFNVYGAGSTGSTANSATAAMTIASTGYVGISSSSPQGILDVEGGTAGAGNNGSNINVYAQNAGSGGHNGGNMLLIPGSSTGAGVAGKIGIGSASPRYIVDATWSSGQVYTSSSSSYPSAAYPGPGAAISLSNTASTDGIGAYLLLNEKNASSKIQSAYIGAISNTGAVYTPTIVIGHQTGATAYAEYMRIDTSGNVGIGTTTMASMFEVNGNASIGYADTAATSNGLIVSGNVGIGTTVPAYLLHVGSASASGIVEELQNSSGNCTFQPSSSALQVVCSSDRRLKEDIDDAVPALPQLADMRVRNYTIKASGERTIGVIAQEMIWKHPDLVHMGPDGFYGVEAPNVWLLVKAIQELKAANDDMADSLKAANDNIADLRDSFEAYKAAHP